MTLDEAIKDCKKKAEYYRELIITECEDGREFYNPDAERYAEEHEQLAEWLKELRKLKKCRECPLVKEECKLCGFKKG